MNSRRAVVVIILSIFYVGCHSSVEPESESSLPAIDESGGVSVSSTGEAFFLEPKELDAQKTLALEGSNDAAVRVANHYSLGGVNPEESHSWFALAAERGDLGAMRSLAVYLNGEGRGCRKSLEWIERAEREASSQENQQHGITETRKHIEDGFAECIRKEAMRKGGGV